MTVRRSAAGGSRRTLGLAVAVAVVAATATLALLGVDGTLESCALGLLPALLLAIALLAGCYPGERLIERWNRARLTARRRRTAAPLHPRRSAVLPRGGRLIGVALAGRAPPAVTAR